MFAPAPSPSIGEPSIALPPTVEFLTLDLGSPASAPDQSSPPPVDQSPPPDFLSPPVDQSPPPDFLSPPVTLVPAPPDFLSPPPPDTHSPSPPLRTPSTPLSPVFTPSSPSDSFAPPPPSRSNSNLVVPIAAGASVVVVSVVLLGLVVLFCTRRRRQEASREATQPSTGLQYREYSYPQKFEPARSSMKKDQRGSSNGGGSHARYDQQKHAQAVPVVVEMARGTYSFDELSKSTNGFSTDNILGQGGFGQVFKGSLNGMEIAVKKLRQEGGQGDKEFRAEVDIISLVHHKNLVSLVGHCIHGDQRLLVYEFVSNKTLDFHLRGNREVTLNWQNRFKIALGAARGLAYLHEDCGPKIIHRDIKASNILVDSNFEPKVADFGLARFQPTDRTHVSTRVMGTFGYIAPEFATSGRLTDKADVYAFGVVLLEIITGRAPAQQSNSYMDETLVGWARPLLRRALEDGEYDNLIDPRLGLNYEPYGMARMIECAAAAVRQTPRRRPAMIQLMQHLQGEIVAEDLGTSMPPGQSSSISFGAFNSGQRSTDMDTGIRRLRTGSHSYASSEFSGHSSIPNPVMSDTNFEPVAR